jgi:hypothetical protein
MPGYPPLEQPGHANRGHHSARGIMNDAATTKLDNFSELPKPEQSPQQSQAHLWVRQAPQGPTSSSGQQSGPARKPLFRR